jgi:hypothetical protein
VNVVAKEIITDEVSILRYFETGPIEKVEVVFNIVRAKMNERLEGRETGGGEARPPKRRSQPGAQSDTSTPAAGQAEK